MSSIEFTHVLPQLDRVGSWDRNLQTGQGQAGGRGSEAEGPAESMVAAASRPRESFRENWSQSPAALKKHLLVSMSCLQDSLPMVQRVGHKA